MENASKALLIAGAILIVILLIAVGMLVYSQSRGAIDTGVAQMSSAEIQMFNSQFTNYEGMQSEKTTKKILQAIINNNTIYKDDKSKWVYCTIEKYYKAADGSTHTTTDGAFITQKELTYDKIVEDINNIIKYIDDNTYKGNKNFKIILNYNDEGLVNYIQIKQLR